MDGCVKCNVVGKNECEPDSTDLDNTLRRVNMETYLLDTDRYQLRDGRFEGAPKCPYGNRYKWIGFDLELKEYVRFTKSVFKLLVNKLEQ